MRGGWPRQVLPSRRLDELTRLISRVYSLSSLELSTMQLSAALRSHLEQKDTSSLIKRKRVASILNAYV